MTSTEAGPSPGVAPERTRLSWLRTILAGTAVTLLIAKLASRRGFASPRLTVAVLALLGWVAILLIGRYRIRSINEYQAPPSWVPTVTAACLAWLAVLGGVLAVLP